MRGNIQWLASGVASPERIQCWVALVDGLTPIQRSILSAIIDPEIGTVTLSYVDNFSQQSRKLFKCSIIGGRAGKLFLFALPTTQKYSRHFHGLLNAY